MKAATEMIAKATSKNTNDNRVFYFTDMDPKMSSPDCKDMLKEFQDNAINKVYTTFLGVGIDFNIDLVSAITKTKACNYFTIQSPKDFKRLMSEEFDYIVTTNVFDVKGTMDAQGWKVERVFGSPGFEIPNAGCLYQIDSSFPSLTKTGETKGGVILIKLTKDPSLSAASWINFTVEYETREGKKVKEAEQFVFGEEPKDATDFFQNSAIQKAVLLTRYVSFMKHFLEDEYKNQDNRYIPTIDINIGIIPPAISPTKMQSSSAPTSMRPLNKQYKELFTKFISHFEKESEVLDDPRLADELLTLTTIADYTEASLKQ